MASFNHGKTATLDPFSLVLEEFFHLTSQNKQIVYLSFFFFWLSGVNDIVRNDEQIAETNHPELF